MNKNNTEIAITKVKLTDIDLLQQIGKETFIQTFSDTNTEENMKTYLTEGFSRENYWPSSAMMSLNFTSPF
ncbi:Uncharacterised protein [Sphingobacterium multivorum]|uniref:N-acetyltransferase domain-containing protein n=1 Tax=Sphingobacterium multivorum TaxID=28454 RepID=A0A2X2JJX7_SPHMU|nr:hypothetical protein [Sphingobacterium multivorum]SPZ92331.1 Uncharacterised protein [Sphingobacterium multivorum]